MKGLCPRCDSETVVLGISKLEAASKKQIRISIRQCPKCGLIFNETV
jgi:transcription elongation factor Elf1